MIQTSNILTACKRRWEESPDLLALVPGRLHGGRVPMTTFAVAELVAPYATLMVKETEPIFNSSLTVIYAFNCQLRVWSDAGNVAAGKIGTAIDFAFRRRDINEVMVVDGADRILDFMPRAGALDEDPATKDAKDQIVLTRQWDMLVQATAVLAAN